ncbi:S-adenosyl-L-methionine-dependent methyltransferase [Syncephalis fuscata]|nr:S-adenosyl-L-methionine-dependent methyltransferase [Syncephalis fuscata]
MRDSLVEYTYVSGRRYINTHNAPYALPVDFKEMDRQVLQDILFDMATGSLYTAPIRYPQSILDLGSGNCSWMLKMASQFSNSNLMSVDILPLSPEVTLPDNCQFELANIIDPQIPFSNNSFDFVHHRQLAMAIPQSKWKSYVADCARVTAPGGWVEISELNILFTNSGPVGQQVHKLVETFAKARGIHVQINDELGHLMTEAGLDEVQCEVYQIPVGEWGGQLGKFAWANYYHALGGILPHLAAVNNITLDDIRVLIEALREEANMNQYCCDFYCHYGKKPALNESISSV